MSNQRDYRARLYEQYLTACATDKSKLTDRYYRRWARVAIGHFKKLLPQDKKVRILDVGCGHGTMLYTLKSLGYENLMGVDCSREQVELARKIHPHVEEADALEFLKDHSDSFDTIIAIDLIEHFTKNEALEFLDLCRNALAPGGRLILHLPNANSLLGMAIACGDFGHEVFYTPRSLRQALSISGFENVRILPTGPIPHGLLSSVRWVLWKLFIIFPTFLDLVERSSYRDRIYTRTMVATARKPLENSND